MVFSALARRQLLPRNDVGIRRKKVCSSSQVHCYTVTGAVMPRAIVSGADAPSLYAAVLYPAAAVGCLSK